MNLNFLKDIFVLLLFIKLSIPVNVPWFEINPEDTAARIAQHGYPVETHNVHTEDGYVLTVFRLPCSLKSENQTENRSVVFVQHGLFSSSDSWILLGPDNSLAFLLCDAGFDVWLGNSRGNTYGQKHIKFDHRNPIFWRFSFHEIGYYDLPAMIDYALQISKARSLQYIGYSQGTSIAFVLLTTRPEYKEKISMAQMLAPVTYVRNLQDRIIRLFGPIVGNSDIIGNFISGQLIPENDLFLLLSYNVCSENSIFKGICLMAINLLQGDPRSLNKTALVYLSKTHPAGTSANQIIHWMQLHESGKFRQYDYGNRLNKQKYGQNTPPDYDLTKLTTKFHLWHSKNDALSTKLDVEKLITQLPFRTVHYISDPYWDHLDYFLANDLRKYVYNSLLNEMEILK